IHKPALSAVESHRRPAFSRAVHRHQTTARQRGYFTAIDWQFEHGHGLALVESPLARAQVRAVCRDTERDPREVWITREKALTDHSISGDLAQPLLPLWPLVEGCLWKSGISLRCIAYFHPRAIGWLRQQLALGTRLGNHCHRQPR